MPVDLAAWIDAKFADLAKAEQEHLAALNAIAGAKQVLYDLQRVLRGEPEPE